MNRAELIHTGAEMVDATLLAGAFGGLAEFYNLLANAKSKEEYGVLLYAAALGISGVVSTMVLLGGDAESVVLGMQIGLNLAGAVTAIGKKEHGAPLYVGGLGAGLMWGILGIFAEQLPMASGKSMWTVNDVTSAAVRGWDNYFAPAIRNISNHY